MRLSGVALGRLDRDDPRDRREGDGGRVVGTAEDDPQLVLVEALEQLGGRRRADEPAAVEDGDVIAHALDVVEDVGGVEDRDLALELAHQVEDLAPTDRVERADWLVEQEHGRRADQGLADAEALAHPARVRAGSAVGRIGEADPGEDRVDPRLVGAAFGRIERGDEPQRLPTGHPVVEPRLLGEVADLAAVAGAGLDRDAGDRRGAAGGLGQSGEELDGGRLPGAVGPEEAVDRAGRDVEGEVGQGRHARVVLGESGRRDGRVLCHPMSPMSGERGSFASAIRFGSRGLGVVGPWARTRSALWLDSPGSSHPAVSVPAHPGRPARQPSTDPGRIRPAS